MFLPRLEKLDFHGEYSQGTRLVRMIEKGTMPHLTHVDAHFSPLWTDDILPRPPPRNVELEKDIAKELQRVCKERNISFQNRFVKVEKETEDLSEYGEYADSPDNDWEE